MGKAYVYVGTNSLRGSQGIYTLSLDTQSGIMEVIDTAAAQDSAYLCLSRDGRRLYAVMESLEYEGKKGGGVASYQIEDGHLTRNGQVYAGGGWPCHISFGPAEREVYVSVFRNGSWMIFPLDRAGRLLEAAGEFHYSDPNGRPSHVHAAMLDPAGKYIAVADCGLDAVYLYGATSHDQVWREEFPEDTGPRQLAFSGMGNTFIWLQKPAANCMSCGTHPKKKKSFTWFRWSARSAATDTRAETMREDCIFIRPENICSRRTGDTIPSPSLVWTGKTGWSGCSATRCWRAITAENSRLLQMEKCWWPDCSIRIRYKVSFLTKRLGESLTQDILWTSLLLRQWLFLRKKCKNNSKKFVRMEGVIANANEAFLTRKQLAESM